jgi:hypothetical protein
MSLRPTASEFVPRMRPTDDDEFVPRMRPTASEFVPRMRPYSDESAARNIQRRVRGRQTRKRLTQRKPRGTLNRDITLNDMLQHPDISGMITDRYILDNELPKNQTFLDMMDRKSEFKKEIDRMETMNIMKCNRVARMLRSEPRIYQDSSFVKRYVEPCRDDTTGIYLETFREIPFTVIYPGSKDVDLEEEFPYGGVYKSEMFKKRKEFLQNVECKQMIKSIPNSIGPNAWRMALIDTLLSLNLLDFDRGFVPYGTEKGYKYMYQLADFFKFSPMRGMGQVAIKHRKIEQYKVKFPAQTEAEEDGLVAELDDIDGFGMLLVVLDLFEETIRDRRLKGSNDQRKIEKFKRYFILMLIGLVQNPDYIDQLNFRRDRLEAYIRRVQEDTAIGLGDESEYIRLRNLTVKKYQTQLDFLVPWIESAEEFYYPTRE